MGGVARATLVIIFMNVAGKLLGFVRETVIAGQYGATYLTDAYLVAYTLPYFLQMVLGMALVTVIVPVVTKYLVRDEKEEAWRIASITLNWTVLFMAAFTLLGVIGAKVLVYLTAPGFDEATAGLAQTLTVIMFPSVIFMGAGMLVSGILNANKSFAAAAFVPGFISLVIIAFVLTLGRLGVSFLAWGTLVGMSGSLFIQLPSLRKVGFCYSWDWNFKHPEVKGIFANIFPIFLGTAVNQLYLAINRIFASGLAEGSISALNYASKLMNLPLGVFVLAISSAIYPTLAEQAVREDKEKLILTLNRGLKMVLLVTFPAAVGLMALDVPIVKLLFERGAFDAQATKMTAQALFFFGTGMFAMGANMVITRAYYALRDVKTPLVMGLLSVVVNVLASVVFTRYLGHSGLALANSTAAIFNTVALYAFLTRRFPRLYFAELAISSGKSLGASLLTGLAAFYTYGYLAEGVLAAQGTRILLVRVMLAVAAGVVVYGVSIIVLREKEALYLFKTGLDKIRLRLAKGV